MKAEQIRYIEDDNQYVLMKPNIYIGSTQKNQVDTYLCENNKFEKKTIEYIPAFIKIIDEVCANCVDEFIKTNGKFANKIKIETDQVGRITISDNGRGLSSEIEPTTQLPQAVIAFTKLKAGSNFEKESESIGQNGVGASLVNIFSKEFFVETSDGIKKTTINCSNNNSKLTWNQRKNTQQYTIVSFLPDYPRFNMETLDEISLKLIEKRLINLNLTYPEISFTFNGKVLPKMTLKNYINMFEQDCLFFSEYSENVDIAIIPWQKETEFISFVNGVDTYKHGQHLVVFNRLMEKAIKDSSSKILKDVTLNQLLTNCKVILIVKKMKNPTFSAQIKDELTNSYSEVKEYFKVDFDHLIVSMLRNKEFANAIQEYSDAINRLNERKNLEKDEKKLKKHKVSKYLAPISNRLDMCHFYLCEGDSAIAQLINVRDNFTAGYPMKGKAIPNPRTAKMQKLLNNETLRDILALCGLKLSSPSIDDFKFKSIRILTDSDSDGDCITSQLLNIFYTFWPDLFKQNKIHRVISPLIIAKHKKTKNEEIFYSLAEFIKEQNNYDILEYNKGLGSLTLKEYEKLVKEPKIIEFTIDEFTDQKFELLFGKGQQDNRKEWLNGDETTDEE